jgi:hypothetical protein
MINPRLSTSSRTAAFNAEAHSCPQVGKITSTPASRLAGEADVTRKPVMVLPLFASLNGTNSPACSGMSPTVCAFTNHVVLGVCSALPHQVHIEASGLIIALLTLFCGQGLVSLEHTARDLFEELGRSHGRDAYRITSWVKLDDVRADDRRAQALNQPQHVARG